MMLHEVSFFLACVGLVLISLEVHEVNAEYNCEYKKDGFYADDDFCHIYWRCNYGVAEEYECPAGTAWNHLESRCDWLDNVDCTRVKNKEESGEKDDEDKDLMSDDETTKKSKKSKKTTTEREEQQHSITTTNESPDDVTDHKIADLFTSSSDKPNSNTNSNPNALCQPFGSYYIPDNSNCMSYYFCNNGVETKMTCTDKKLFNSETSQCEDYQHVFCANRPVNMADRNQCTGKRDGIYPDVERTCRVFYQCINQVKIREASCPSILRFNSISGKCDNPINIIAPCGTIGAVNQAAGSSVFTQQSAMFLALVVLLFSTVFLL